jgi:hypothetical protein
MHALGPLNIRTLETTWVLESMFDGSAYPKNLMQMFEYLAVLRYASQWMQGVSAELQPLLARQNIAYHRIAKY